jgi:hypothetical protein
MNSDDYAKKQAKRDAEYERDYRAWVESLPAEDRKKVEAAGLGKPMLARHGNGAPDGDLADSPAASHTPDIADLVDHRVTDDDEGDETIVMDAATRMLRSLVADLIAQGNARLTLECLAVALGLSIYNGDSMSDIARRHGVTRAAVSKRCVDITRKLNLLPSRAMRSIKARRSYQRSQIKAKTVQHDITSYR